MAIENNKAAYACHAENSRGRLHREEEGVGRSPYQRDRDRIIHSTAFRRLEYKTQVFVYHEGDHYRTRLTHSLEVAQLSRSVSRELGLDEDLAEAIALAHDLGHPPFGHAGEEALRDAMKAYGGFDHNAQTIRMITNLEDKYAEFDGLNLTWECLEGIAKHNGPVTGDVPRALAEYNQTHNLELETYAGPEAQISSLCDDIAYNNHDVEDGLRADLFAVEDLFILPVVGDVFQMISEKYPGLEKSRLVHESKRRLINMMVRDMVEMIRKNIAESDIKSADDVRNLGHPIAGFSEKMGNAISSLRDFLYNNMYRHYRVNRMTSKARMVISELFEFFMRQPDCLPTEWYRRVGAGNNNEQHKAEIVADFIAGMTDRFAMEEHRRIFDTSYKLIGR